MSQNMQNYMYSISWSLIVTYCLSKSYRYSNTWCPSKYYMYLITLYLSQNCMYSITWSLSQNYMYSITWGLSQSRRCSITWCLMQTYSIYNTKYHPCWSVTRRFASPRKVKSSSGKPRVTLPFSGRQTVGSHSNRVIIV